MNSTPSFLEERSIDKKSLEQEIGINGYCTASPGIGGQIRRSPEDFVVWEIDPSGKRVTEDYFPCNARTGLFTTFTLKKTNYDTPTALSRLSRVLNRPLKDFGYCGLKDARALTYQRVSIWDISPKELNSVLLNRIEIFNPIRTTFGLKQGELWGNAFRVVVFGIKYSPKDTTSRIGAIQQELSEFGGIPNYFGTQRFGERAISHLVGKALVKGRAEEAVVLYLTKTSSSENQVMQLCRQNLVEMGDLKEFLNELPPQYDYERILAEHLLKRPQDAWGAINSLPRDILRLFVHAFQSYLFNKTLSTLLRNPEILSVGLDIPLAGSETNLSSFSTDVSEIFSEILEVEGIILDQIDTRQLGFRSRGSRRAALINPKDLKIKLKKIDTVRFCFSLPAGSYATILLREFMKE